MHHLRSSFIPVGASVGADWSSALAGDATTAKAAEASGMKKVHLAPYVMLALALLGTADAFYVAHASYTGQPLRELIIEGANTVLNSPYARIFGMPLSYFGLVYYSYMFGLAALSLSTHPRVVCALARFSTPRWACCPRSTSCTFSSTSSRRCASTVSSPPLRHFFFSSLLSHISKRRDSGQDEAVVDVGQRTPIHVDCTYSDLISIKAGSLVVANNF